WIAAGAFRAARARALRADSRQRRGALRPSAARWRGGAVSAAHPRQSRSRHGAGGGGWGRADRDAPVLAGTDPGLAGVVAAADVGVLLRGSVCLERRTRVRRPSGPRRTGAQQRTDSRCHFTAPMHLELVAHVVHVILDRRRFDPQLAADLLV